MQESSSRETKRAVDVGTVAGKGEAAVGQWLAAIGASVSMRDGRAVAVGLNSTSITDRELVLLKDLPLLEELSLRDTEISDLGLPNLAGLRALKKLDLSSTSLSDSALNHLKPLVGLQSLDLSHTLVEGPGLTALASLAQLRELNLGSTPLDDEGIRHDPRADRPRETVAQLHRRDRSGSGIRSPLLLISQSSISPAQTSAMPVWHTLGSWPSCRISISASRGSPMPASRTSRRSRS